MDTEAYLSHKSAVVFEFLDLEHDGVLTREEIKHYPRQLEKRGQTDYATKLDNIYSAYFSKICEIIGKDTEATSLTKDEFIRGNDALRKTDWFVRDFIDPLTDVYFDSIDRNHDTRISLKEWRQMYNTRGIEDENFIKSTFAKMDRDGDGEIDRDEFKYAFVQYGIGTDQGQDYSFLYNIRGSV